MEISQSISPTVTMVSEPRTRSNVDVVSPQPIQRKRLSMGPIPEGEPDSHEPLIPVNLSAAMGPEDDV